MHVDDFYNNHFCTDFAFFSFTSWLFEDEKCRLWIQSKVRKRADIGNWGKETDEKKKKNTRSRHRILLRFLCTIANSVVSSMKNISELAIIQTILHRGSWIYNIRLLSPTEWFLRIRAPFYECTSSTIQFYFESVKSRIRNIWSFNFVFFFHFRSILDEMRQFLNVKPAVFEFYNALMNYIFFRPLSLEFSIFDHFELTWICIFLEITNC